jgi:hypothetical protein
VTFAVRGEASITTRVATSSGVVIRPVARPPIWASAIFLAVSGSTPVGVTTVCATPSLTQPKIRVYRTRRQTAELIIDWVLKCHRKSYEHLTKTEKLAQWWTTDARRFEVSYQCHMNCDEWRQKVNKYRKEKVNLTTPI